MGAEKLARYRQKSLQKEGVGEASKLAERAVRQRPYSLRVGDKTLAATD